MHFCRTSYFDCTQCNSIEVANNKSEELRRLYLQKIEQVENEEDKKEFLALSDQKLLKLQKVDQKKSLALQALAEIDIDHKLVLLNEYWFQARCEQTYSPEPVTYFRWHTRFPSLKMFPAKSFLAEKLCHDDWMALVDSWCSPICSTSEVLSSLEKSPIRLQERRRMQKQMIMGMRRRDLGKKCRDVPIYPKSSPQKSSFRKHKPFR